MSRRFYEKFDDIVNELVEWLNQVDFAYRSELREQNELNFARFDARLREQNEMNFARFDAKLDQRLAELRAELIKWMFLFWAGIAFAGLLLR